MAIRSVPEKTVKHAKCVVGLNMVDFYKKEITLNKTTYVGASVFDYLNYL